MEPTIPAVPFKHPDAGPQGGSESPAAASDRVHHLSQASPEPGRTEVSGAFHLEVEDAAQVICPKCSSPAESPGVALNLKFGPLMEGTQVLLIRRGASMKSVIDDVRRALMSDALARANGVQSSAAKLLGMKYTTFHTLARRLGLGRSPKTVRADAGGPARVTPLRGAQTADED